MDSLSTGLSGRLDAPPSILMVIVAFTAIAWWNAIELNIMVFKYFRTHKNLYFWSLLISSWGVVLHSLAFMAKFFHLWTNNYVSVSVIVVGWYMMVTGQSLVLFSRLHLVMHNRRKLRKILYLLMVDAVIFHVPTTVLVFGTNSSQANRYVAAYSIYEKVQISGFFLQEAFLSGLYVYYTWKILKPHTTVKRRIRQMKRDLILVNVLIVIMDLPLLGSEFAGYYEIETTYKSLLYSVKLKMEFAILNQLVMFTHLKVDPETGHRNEGRNWSGSNGKSNGAPKSEYTPPSVTYSAGASTAQPIKTMESVGKDQVVKTVDMSVEFGQRRHSTILRSQSHAVDDAAMAVRYGPFTNKNPDAEWPLSPTSSTGSEIELASIKG